MISKVTASANTARSWSRLDGVDCLRALAIFCVLMNHINMRLVLSGNHYLHGVPRQLAASLVWQGQNGVQIFFAISGFLITATSLRRWGALERVSLRDFYLLRFCTYRAAVHNAASAAERPASTRC